MGGRGRLSLVLSRFSAAYAHVTLTPNHDTGGCMWQCSCSLSPGAPKAEAGGFRVLAHPGLHE